MKHSSKSQGQATIRRLPIGIPRRFSMVSLFVALVLLIITTPFIQDLDYGGLIEGILLTIVFLAALWAMSARRRTFVMSMVFLVPAMLGKWIDYFQPDFLPPAIILFVGILSMAFITIELLRFILRAPHVDTQVLFAGINGYLVLVILWSAAYMFLARLSPDAFLFANAHGNERMTAFTALYFSFGAMTTCGFGDIVPLAKTTRLLSVMESTTGVLYLAILISRLVGMHSSQKASPEKA